MNSHYSPILHGCMNNRRGRAEFKNFLIILDSGCISTIVMRRLIGKLHPEKDAVMQWHTQARNITTNLKVKVDFTLPAISATNVVTWKCHMDESSKGINDMILGRYLLLELGINISFPEHVIKADDGTLKGSTTTMVDFGTYIF